MNGEKMELVEKVVGRMVIRSVMMVGALAVTQLALEKLEQKYLKGNGPLKYTMDGRKGEL